MGGLGRGLAAIFTGPTTPDGDSLRARFVDSALTSLSTGRTLRLCGYVHDIDGDATVTLRAPELQSLHPTEAYQLFSELGALARGTAPDTSFTMQGIDALAVVTAGTRTRGIFFFGDAALDAATADRLTRFCRVYAPVIHDHDRPAGADERIHLVLDQQGGDAHAEITLGSAVGFGSAARPHEAVANAALTAVSPEAKLVEVGEVRSGDGAAAFVVAAGEHGRLGTGAAPVVAGADAAAAVAAVRAGRALAAAA